MNADPGTWIAISTMKRCTWFDADHRGVRFCQNAARWEKVREDGDLTPPALRCNSHRPDGALIEEDVDGTH